MAMNTKQAQIDQMVRTLANSRNTVVVTGAGISTEAGIPDFRGKNGIYRKMGEDRVMTIININTFNSSPRLFYEFYNQYFIFPPVAPSKAHYVLAEMEGKGRIKGIITQNIDGLHEKAGSRRVVAVHGNAEKYVCTNRDCGEVYSRAQIQEQGVVIPTCDHCRTILKPDVILFGEPIKCFTDAQEMIVGARTLLVIGSSLTVYPLAGFVKAFSTIYQDLLIINQGPTQLDHAALVKIDGAHTGDTLEEINHLLDRCG
jgi:NAD-dependent deacetylase